MTSLFMRRMRAGALGCIGLLAVACSAERDAVAYAPAAEARMAADVAAPPPPAAGSGGAPVAEGGAMLAYSYAMGVTAPNTAVAGLMAAHQKACIDAGPAVCQVLGSSVNAWSDKQVLANLSLRAAPAWLETFRATIAADAGGAGGRITSNTVTAEDLTQYIVDVEARLAAKRALRDRLQALIETEGASLGDLLAAERALADVQGEIDSMTAQLAAAKARVMMSALTINYASDPATSTGLFAPLADAFADFGRASVESLADAVLFVAGAWPYFILVMLVLAVLRVWWRGRKRA